MIYFDTNKTVIVLFYIFVTYYGNLRPAIHFLAVRSTLAVSAEMVACDTALFFFLIMKEKSN